MENMLNPNWVLPFWVRVQAKPNWITHPHFSLPHGIERLKSHQISPPQPHYALYHSTKTSPTTFCPSCAYSSSLFSPGRAAAFAAAMREGYTTFSKTIHLSKHPKMISLLGKLIFNHSNRCRCRKGSRIATTSPPTRNNPLGSKHASNTICYLSCSL